MSSDGQYNFAGWHFNSEKQLLSNDRQEHTLEAKQSRVLEALLRSAGSMVSKQELLDAVWKDRVVTEEVLTVAISHLRKHLGDSAKAPRFIKTVPQEGYVFIAAVEAPSVAGNSIKPKVAIFCVAIAIVLVVFLMDHSRKGDANRTSESLQELSLEQQLAHYERIAATNPDDASAHLGAARTLYRILSPEPRLLQNAYEELLTRLRIVTRLQPDNAGAYALLAVVHLYADWNFSAAEQAFANSLRLNPDASDTWIDYSQYRLALKDYEAAKYAMARASQLNPSVFAMIMTAWVNNMEGNTDRALVEVEKLLKSRPGTRAYHFSAQATYQYAGNEDESFKHLVALLRLNDVDDRTLSALKQAFDEQKLAGVYRWLLEQKEHGPEIGQSRGNYAYSRYAAASDQDQLALEFLSQAVAERQIEVLWIAVDPRFSGLRQTPEFSRLVSHIGLDQSIERQVKLTP